MIYSIIKFSSLKRSPGNVLSTITVAPGEESHTNGGIRFENVYGKTVRDRTKVVYC